MCLLNIPKITLQQLNEIYVCAVIFDRHEHFANGRETTPKTDMEVSESEKSACTWLLSEIFGEILNMPFMHCVALYVEEVKNHSDFSVTLGQMAAL
jgi:hypothetical protein